MNKQIYAALFAMSLGATVVQAQGLPTPQLGANTTIGGMKFQAATGALHQFQVGVSTGGSPLFAQPQASDVPFTQYATSFVAKDVNSKLLSLPITPEDFCPLSGCPSDMTANVQLAVNNASAQSRIAAFNGTYSVSHVVFPAGLHFQGIGTFSGNATTSTTSVLEITGGVIDGLGTLSVSANYSMNYASAVWWHGSSQYSQVRGINTGSAQVCWMVGDTAAPSALMSEATIFGGSTYGCAIPLKVIGVETYLNVVGAQWSSDDFGVPSGQLTAWQALPHRGILAIGASVKFIGGELIMPNIVTGYLVESQPLTGTNGEGTGWARVSLVGTTAETASPLAITANPNNLTTTNRGLLSFTDVGGYLSQDTSAFITTSADYMGDVVGRSLSFTAAAPRTNNNVSAGSANTAVYIDDKGFGFNFKDSQTGTVGGTIYGSKFLMTEINGSPYFAQLQYPLSLTKTDGTISNIAIDLNTLASGGSAMLHLSDGFTYNLAFGSGSTGDFEIWTGRYVGVVGTKVAAIKKTGMFHETLHTPTSSSEPCDVGDVTDDSNYHYVCVSLNKWRRSALSDY